MSRKLVFRQPEHCSSMPSEFLYCPLYSLPTFSICASLLISIYSCFCLVISLESIKQEAIQGLQSSKFSSLFLEKLQNSSHQHNISHIFLQREGLTTDSQSGRRKKVAAFLQTVNLPDFHRKSAWTQRIQSSQVINGTLTKKTKTSATPFPYFRSHWLKVLLTTAILSFSHSLLWLP